MSQHIFISVPSIKFKGNLSNGSRADIRGQTDRHDEASQCFSRQCERAVLGGSENIRL